MPGTAVRVDALAGFKFSLRIAGLEAAVFTQCSGLDASVKFDEVREGGLNEYHHVLPGRIEYGNLTLKRGYAVSDELFNWFLSTFNRGTIVRKEVTVVLMNSARQDVMEWTFLGAYPVKWSGPSFNAGENTALIESLELAHRGLQV